MTAWSQARRAGSQARAFVQAEQAGSDGSDVALPLAEERFKEQVCIYCGSKTGLRTGLLAITGPVFYCKDHKEQFRNDKPWEEKHKWSI